MPRVTLKDAQDKLDWARRHFELLRAEVEALAERDAHTFSADVDVNTGEYAFYVHNLESPKPDWGLVVGDCLHNARTALDYLMVRLVSLVTRQQPLEIGRVEFPISADPARFDPKSGKTLPSVNEARRHPGFSGYLARIEELQPFNALNVSVWGDPFDAGAAGRSVIPSLPQALESLAAFDNIDKHRVVHAAWSGLDILESSRAQAFPAGFVLKTTAPETGQLCDGARIAVWKFETPLPHNWQPDQAEMKRAFPLHVSIGEPPAWKNVIEILEFCLWGAQATLDLFEPVFSHSQPPLPVTSVPRFPPPLRRLTHGLDNRTSV